MKRLILMLALTSITTTAVDAANYYPQEPKISKTKIVRDKKMVKKAVIKKPLKAAIAVSK
jgi:fumarate reductase subunit C